MCRNVVGASEKSHQRKLQSVLCKHPTASLKQYTERSAVAVQSTGAMKVRLNKNPVVTAVHTSGQCTSRRTAAMVTPLQGPRTN